MAIALGLSGSFIHDEEIMILFKRTSLQTKDEERLQVS